MERTQKWVGFLLQLPMLKHQRNSHEYGVILRVLRGEVLVAQLDTHAQEAVRPTTDDSDLWPARHFKRHLTEGITEPRRQASERRVLTSRP